MHINLTFILSFMIFVIIGNLKQRLVATCVSFLNIFTTNGDLDEATITGTAGWRSSLLYFSILLNKNYGWLIVLYIQQWTDYYAFIGSKHADISAFVGIRSILPASDQPSFHGEQFASGLLYSSFHGEEFTFGLLYSSYRG